LGGTNWFVLEEEAPLLQGLDKASIYGENSRVLVGKPEERDH
jgi:hypothetical protein